MALPLFLKFKLFFNKCRYLPVSTSHRAAAQNKRAKLLQARGGWLDFWAKMEKDRNQKKK